MLLFIERVRHTNDFTETLTLAFDMRQKARLKTTLDNGKEVGLMLPRGPVLRGGDCLRTESGIVAKVIAAQENVSVASSSNKLSLAKASYHLGNRHIPLQIEEDCVIYLEDHVLDDMVKALGLSVRHEMRAFEPEVGAYHHGHSH